MPSISTVTPSSVFRTLKTILIFNKTGVQSNCVSMESFSVISIDEEEIEGVEARGVRKVFGFVFPVMYLISPSCRP